MKCSLTAFLFVVLLIPLQSRHATDLTLSKDTTIQVYFSPDGGCIEAISKVPDQVKQEILVQAYSFTSAPIAKALLDAHKHGVSVHVILDNSQKTEKYSVATFFKTGRIFTFINDKRAIATGADLSGERSHEIS